jgi:hypothetical protein
MSSPVRRELEEFLAGRGTPERVVIAVTIAFYRESQGVQREILRPLIQVIDRASPGVVELGSVSGGRGFEVRLAERQFPPEQVAALRQAAEQVLRGAAAAESKEPNPGWVRIEAPPPPEPGSEPRPTGLWGWLLQRLKRFTK